MNKSIVSQSLLLLGTVVLLSCRYSEGISCYECISDISGKNISCATVSSSQSQSKDSELACFTTVWDYGDGRLATVERGFYSPGGIIPYCSNSQSGESTCYCSGNNCNDQPIETPSYTCFSCVSTPLLPNGCADGVDWNSGSEYVKKEAGCYACGKTKSFNGDVKRWCEQSLYAPNECTTSLTQGTASTGASFTTTCYCRGDQCNSANQLTKSTGVYLSLFLISAACFLSKIVHVY